MDPAYFIKFSFVLAFSLQQAAPLGFNCLLIPGVKRNDGGMPILQM